MGAAGAGWNTRGAERFDSPGGQFAGVLQRRRPTQVMLCPPKPVKPSLWEHQIWVKYASSRHKIIGRAGLEPALVICLSERMQFLHMLTVT